jgi:hypothetical protein
MGKISGRLRFPGLSQGDIAHDHDVRENATFRDRAPAVVGSFLT